MIINEQYPDFACDWRHPESIAPTLMTGQLRDSVSGRYLFRVNEAGFIDDQTTIRLVHSNAFVNNGAWINFSRSSVGRF